MFDFFLENTASIANENVQSSCIKGVVCVYVYKFLVSQWRENTTTNADETKNDKDVVVRKPNLASDVEEPDVTVCLSSLDDTSTATMQHTHLLIHQR